MMSAGMTPIVSDAGRKRDVHGALEHAVEAAERHVVDPDDRQPVQILEPRAERDELQEIRHDVNVDALAAGELDDAEHLDVLVDRQRDVDFVDLLVRGRSRPLRRSCRAAAARDSRWRRSWRPSSTNPTSRKPELAVVEDPIGDHAAEIAGADDEHALADRCPRASAAAADRARLRATCR